MTIHGVSGNSAAQYLQQLQQTHSAPKAKGTTDANHDGDIDGPGKDTNDASGTSRFINVTA